MWEIAGCQDLVAMETSIDQSCDQSINYYIKLLLDKF